MELYRRAVSMSRDPGISRWLSPLLLTADSALCALIIWKVPCMFPANPILKLSPFGSMSCRSRLTLLRYRDRLESVHAASPSIPRRGTQLHPDQRGYWALGIPSSTRLHIQWSVSHHERRGGYIPSSAHFWRLVYRRVEPGHGMLSPSEGAFHCGDHGNCILFGITKLTLRRHRPTSSLSLSFQSACIAYSCSGFSTTVSLWEPCSWLFTHTRNVYGQSVALHIRSG